MTAKNSSSLRDMQAMIRKFVDERDWDQFHNPKDLSISLSLESAEVMEHFQWKNLEEMVLHSRSQKDDIGDELADVFYWVLLIANKLDIDLVDAFERKMVKNAKKYPVDKSRGNHKKYTEHED